ncbi:hypothetical protein ACFGOO_12045 [Treponema vincentii]|uniref:hypothetical protein n=1 Tax=Treponema vincentii TaxID=69710 RepID=UPI0035F5782C
MKCDDIISILNLAIAVFATFYIPKKMMNNQIYADLIGEYRKPEIGEAIIAVIDFYTKDCKSDVEMIEKKYFERYETDKQNGKYENSLHFQRRLLSQYYYQLAALRYQGGWFTRLSKKKVREDFTAREAKLLSLLSYMNKAAENIFTDYDIAGMPYADDKQNALLQKLYDEAQQW